MTGFRGTGVSLAAIARASRFVGPPPKLLAAVAAVFVADALSRLLRNLPHGMSGAMPGWNVLCSGATAFLGQGGNNCGVGVGWPPNTWPVIAITSGTQTIVGGDVGPHPNPALAAAGWQAGTIQTKYTRNIGQPPWPSIFLKPMPLSGVGARGDDAVIPDVIVAPIVGGFAAAKPGTIGVNDVLPIPPWAVPMRDAVQQRLASLSSTMTQRGYAYPGQLPLPIPIPGREIIITPTQAYSQPITQAQARTAAPPAPYTNEIKTRAYPVVSQFMQTVVGVPSEVNDMLQALHDALPKRCQVKSRKAARQSRATRAAGGWKRGYRKARTDSFSLAHAIAQCADHMDIPEATKNLAEEALKDRAYGGMGRALGGLNRQAGLPIGVQQMVNKAPKMGDIIREKPPKVDIPYKWSFGEARGKLSKVTYYGGSYGTKGATFLMNK